MDEISGGIDEVAATKERTGEKFTAEIDSNKLDEWVRKYGKQYQQAYFNIRSMGATPMDKALVGITRDLFRTFNQLDRLIPVEEEHVAGQKNSNLSPAQFRK